MSDGGRPARRFAIGAVAASAVAAAAYRAHAIDRGGAVAAVAVGTATNGALGLRGAGVLLAFFVSSVALSRVGKTRKRALLVDVDKTGARDAAQVLANGGVAALCALAAARFDRDRFAIAFAGAFAAAAADTWATEIGTLVKQPPRSILTLRPIATGLSGGVTFAGSAAMIAGASFVALVARVLDERAFAPVLVAGTAGALVDSLLGASLQTLRWCSACNRATERERHICGAPTRAIRGISWFGNDAVNVSATVAGAVLAWMSARET